MVNDIASLFLLDKACVENKQVNHEDKEMQLPNNLITGGWPKHRRSCYVGRNIGHIEIG